MSILLQFQKVQKIYSSSPLFEDLSFSVHQGDHIAIIGRNGTGKSTLLKMVMNEVSPDQGQVIASRGLRVGYISQLNDFSEGDTVFQYFERKLLDSGLDPVAKDQKIYSALSQISEVDEQKKMAELSGGWQKRMMIIANSLLEFDLLLLDEPTNHMDIDGVLWLEAFLKKTSMTWILVSHDRYFLNQVAQRTIEITPIGEGYSLDFKGGYDEFNKQKSLFIDGLIETQKSMRNKARRENEWLKAGVKARTTKSVYRKDQALKLFEDLRDLNSKLNIQKSQIEFQSQGIKSKKLIELKNVSFSYEGLNIVENFSLIINSKSRMAIVGRNGVGKSTLLKLINKAIEPQSGQVTHVNELSILYFEQERSSLSNQDSIKDVLAKGHDSVYYRGKSVSVAAWAAKFQFDFDALNKKVGQLSGGEKARLLIAQLLLKESSVLLLDEPTNDLDIEVLEVLEESLKGFEGAVIMISHDRHLIQNNCDEFIGLDGSGQVVKYSSYEQWERSLNAGKPIPVASQSPAVKKIEKKSEENTPKVKKLTYAEQIELESMEDQVLTAEENLATIENEYENLNLSDSQLLMDYTEKLKKANEEVEKLYQRWNELEQKPKF